MLNVSITNVINKAKTFFLQIIISKLRCLYHFHNYYFYFIFRVIVILVLPDSSARLLTMVNNFGREFLCRSLAFIVFGRYLIWNSKVKTIRLQYQKVLQRGLLGITMPLAMPIELQLNCSNFECITPFRTFHQHVKNYVFQFLINFE